MHEYISRDKWFLEFEKHLMEDSEPSKYFLSLVEGGTFPAMYPFGMLTDLTRIPQSPVHHPEGDVWKHTMLVVDNAAVVRQRSADPCAFMWAALLHDLGKALMTRKKGDRIIAYDHDKAGKKLAHDFLSACGQDQAFIKKVSALVRWHMQPFFVVKNMPFADVDALLRQTDPNEVALLSYCDRLGRGDTAEKKAEAEKQNMTLFLKKCRRREEYHHAKKDGVDNEPKIKKDIRGQR